MRQGLHPVLTLLLAFLVLGAGTQSALCELACGLGSRIPCHGVAVSSADAASANSSMAGMHCSGMKSSQSLKAVASGLRFEAQDAGPCRHPSPLATMNSVTASESVAAVHWIFVEPVPMQHALGAYRFIASSEAPPLRSAGDSLLITLRV